MAKQSRARAWKPGRSLGTTQAERRPSRACLHVAVRVLSTAALALGVFAGSPAWAEDAVTEWTVEAERLGGGGANWHTSAIMHMAMHDAAETILHRYDRWYPEGEDQIVGRIGAGASVEATIACGCDGPADVGAEWSRRDRDIGALGSGSSPTGPGA